MDAFCRDELERLALPDHVAVLEMAAQEGVLAVRTRDEDDGFEPPTNEALRIVASEPPGFNLLQFDVEGALYSVVEGCTPSCGDWLKFASGPRSPLRRWETPQLDARMNALAVPTSWGSRALWASFNGSSGFLQSLGASGVVEANRTLDEAIIGLTTDSDRAYVATGLGEVIALSLPDLTEVGRIQARGVSLSGHGALLRRSWGAYFLAQTDNASTELRIVDQNLEVGAGGVDVFDALHFAEELDEVFFSTELGVEKIENDGAGTLSRRVIATSTERGVIQAIAYDEPFLYVALQGVAPKSPFRAVIQALEIGACTDRVR